MYVNIDVLTLFPEQFSGVFEHSIIKRARDKFLAEIKIHNLRDWAADKYKSVDDRPYGGGAGMILRVDIIKRAIEFVAKNNKKDKAKIILTSAKGKKYS